MPYSLKAMVLFCIITLASEFREHPPEQYNTRLCSKVTLPLVAAKPFPYAIILLAILTLLSPDTLIPVCSKLFRILGEPPLTLIL